MANLSNWRMLAGLIAGLVLVLQFVPVERDNPPVKSDLAAPPDIEVVLRRACYDCHSNETVWPWYAHVAPMSWLVAHDVHEARSEMNFSKWRDYRPDQRAKHLREMLEEVEQGNMPPVTYRVVHGSAALRGAEIEALRRWVEDGSEAGAGAETGAQ